MVPLASRAEASRCGLQRGKQTLLPVRSITRRLKVPLSSGLQRAVSLQQRVGRLMVSAVTLRPRGPSRPCWRRADLRAGSGRSQQSSTPRRLSNDVRGVAAAGLLGAVQVEVGASRAAARANSAQAPRFPADLAYGRSEHRVPTMPRQRRRRRRPAAGPPRRR
jgi:hypothetical protein